MARRLLTHPDGTPCLFPEQDRAALFLKAETIEAELHDLQAMVIRRRDPELGLWRLAICLCGRGRDVFERDLQAAYRITHDR